MKLAHVITDLDVGGAEVMLDGLLRPLAHAGCHSTVISLTTVGPIGERIRRRGVEVVALGVRPGRPPLAALLRLRRLLTTIKPDIVQTWLYHADLAGLVAAVLARLPRTVWNIRCAELDPRDHPRSLPALLRLLALASRFPAAVICNSKAGLAAHRRLGYVPRRWAIIPNGFDTARFKPDPAARPVLRRELGAGDAAPVVGLLARRHPMKDHATFLRAAALVAQERRDVYFVAAGRGVADDRALAAAAADLHILDRVRLMPERSDPPAFLAGLDLAVSSSYSEAFPNVVGEAMACGTPCVATDVGESAEIVGETGAVVAPRTPPALADAILRLLALSPAERRALGVQARERIETKFSIEAVGLQYVGLYQELVVGKQQKEHEASCAG